MVRYSNSFIGPRGRHSLLYIKSHHVWTLPCFMKAPMPTGIPSYLYGIEKWKSVCTFRRLERASHRWVGAPKKEEDGGVDTHHFLLRGVPLSGQETTSWIYSGFEKSTTQWGFPVGKHRGRHGGGGGFSLQLCDQVCWVCLDFQAWLAMITNKLPQGLPTPHFGRRHRAFYCVAQPSLLTCDTPMRIHTSGCVEQIPHICFLLFTCRRISIKSFVGQISIY